MKLLVIVCCALLFGACGTSFKVAPSTTKVSTNLATAKRSTQEATKRSALIEKKTQDTHVAAETVAGNIDAALAALVAKDYVGAAKHMIDAKGGNIVVMELLRQSLVDMVALRGNFDQVATDLNTAETALEDYKKSVEKIVEQGAKDRAIVEQVNWGFGLGAIGYGVKRMLTFGFFGFLILAGVAIALLAIGGPAAMFAMRGIKWIFGLFKKRERD